MKAAIFAFLALAAVALADKNQDIILKLVNEGVNPDGSYEYSYDTSNGISAEEKGYQKNPETREAQGRYVYKSPEGQVIETSYVANENGFQPTGNAIPTALPYPAWLVKTLAYLAEHAKDEERKELKRF